MLSALSLNPHHASHSSLHHHSPPVTLARLALLSPLAPHTAASLVSRRSPSSNLPHPLCDFGPNPARGTVRIRRSLAHSPRAILNLRVGRGSSSPPPTPAADS
uniref:Uncharacterized protein n=1 Tax=Knipowitschia caucasica TaxID=637954 RepID=A0AAV2MSM0_KNICA